MLPEALHMKLVSAHESVVKRLRDESTPEEDIQAVGYALAGFADEIMLNASAELREYWMMHLLQVEFYKENVAGERFFEQLEQLMREPGRVDTLALYFRILLLGFKGRYALPGRELALEDIIDRTSARLKDLGKLSVPPISPRWERPLDARIDKRKFPMLSMAFAAFLGAITLFAALRLDMSARIDALIESLETLDTENW